MKYTKSAAALALAGVAASPLALADGHEDSGVTVTLSGQVAIGILGSDADDTPGNSVNIGDPIADETSATGFRPATSEDVEEAASPGDLVVFGDDSTINVKAEGVLDNGLTGYGNYRTDLGLVGDTATGDNIHVGIKGGFGDLRIGEVPDATGYGQVAGDILGNVDSSDIDGENFGVSYTGNFGGVTFGANWSPEGAEAAVIASPLV